MISARGDGINPLDVAMKQADMVGERLKLDLGLCEKVKQIRREIIIHLPVKMDDGGATIFAGDRL